MPTISRKGLRREARFDHRLRRADGRRKADDLKALLNFLRDDPQCRFVCLIDICGVDYPSRPRRFEIVYHLLSPYRNARIRVLETSGEEPVPSAVAIFPAANWFEREAFDLYGVLFSGHPDLRRILTDYGFSATRCARTSR